MRILSYLLVAVPFVIACGGGSGGSGLSDSTKLTDLSTDQAKALCEELTFSREITCEGSTISIHSQNCSDVGQPGASCTATVGDARDCTDAEQTESDAKLCAGDLGAACAKLSGCGMGGDSGAN
jgi:hypothetical protein